MLEASGGVTSGCALGFALFFAGLGINYEGSIAATVVVSAAVPAAAAGMVFKVKRWFLFSVALMAASFVTTIWLWNFVFSLYGTFV